MALSPGDPNSYSRPEEVTTKHLHLDLEVDFTKKVLKGHVLLTLDRVDMKAETVLLDVNKLDIAAVTEECSGSSLSWVVDSPSVNGDRMEIKLPKNSCKEIKVKITYSTTSNCTALQWLEPQQTAGKKHPFLFSQCQAIHCRSMIPCQDSPSVKATYTAIIRAPAPLTTLMSAIADGEMQQEGEMRVTKWTQKIPIQSYLIAIAVGSLESKRIGPRSQVWSEADIIDKAAFDFSETEEMLVKAESLCGPYVWGTYDILVLPPSFPYGGMENPCLTFATPTLLSGDKANADVIAHEIAHSWTGNLVTNCNFEHFWLNEGFTVFTERKIQGLLHGEPARHFSAILRWKSLEETIKVDMGETNPFTCLIPKLAGVDPDDAFSIVPYEKGSTFLWYLEDTVGGASVFEPFLKAYYAKFAYKSIDSETFKAFFLSHFSMPAVEKIDWQTWFHSPGMPPYKPKFDESLARDCWDLAAIWQTWTDGSDTQFASKFQSLLSNQQVEVLATLLTGAPLAHPTLKKMAELYKLEECSNVEVQFRWLRLGIKARWEEAVAPALKLATVQGRMKFVRPLFRDLYGWEDKRQEAIECFKKHRGQMMHVCAEMVAKDLHITN